MYSFNYQKAKSTAEAITAYSAAADARYLAGGQTLLPTLKQRLAMPSDLIDLSKIDALRGITIERESLVIGAMTRHRDVASHSEVRRMIPALAHLADGIGDPQVRNRGTLGGSLANNDPTADYTAAVLGLNAVIHTDKRTISADNYFKGLFETALDPGELIIKVAFPTAKRAGYVKFANPASRYALVGVMVADTNQGIRVAITGAGMAGVFRAPDFEAALSKSFTSDAAKSVQVSPQGLNADIHASAEYRAHLITVMTARAVDMALKTETL